MYKPPLYMNPFRYVYCAWDWSTPDDSNEVQPKLDWLHVMIRLDDFTFLIRGHELAFKCTLKREVRDDTIITTTTRTGEKVSSVSVPFREPSRLYLGRLPKPFLHLLELSPEVTMICRREAENWFLECGYNYKGSPLSQSG